MESSDKKISITYSLADQSFARTKSIGILNVSIELLQALAQKPECDPLTVLSNDSLKERLTPATRMTIERHDWAADHKLGRIWWDQSGAYSAAQRAGNDWLFLPKGFASFSRRCPVRLATFVHDVMQDHYDRHYPEAVSRFEATYFRASLHASLRQSDVIFTPTQFTLDEIQRVAREKGWSVPRLVCCGEGFIQPATAPITDRRDIIVQTSRFPHKLTRLAVDFMDRWCRENPFGEEIHWIGSLPKDLEIPIRPGWRRHTTLPEVEYRGLMARARVVVFFSDYEGFGRPPVEAALTGACPVYSGIPALREVMGDCDHLFDNASYGSFAAALLQALATQPEQLRLWAKVLGTRHDWNIVADRVVSALAAHYNDVR